MRTIDHFYVFPECVRVSGQLKVNIADDQYAVSINNQHTSIAFDQIHKNTANLVLYDAAMGTLTLFKDLDSVTKQQHVLASDFLKAIQKNSLLQIDWFGSGHFVKAFLPMGQVNLLSDTHDFSQCAHFPLTAIHPVDWQYQPSAILRQAELAGSQLRLRIEAIPSILSDSIFYRYGSQTGAIPLGVHDILLSYEPQQVLHIGKHEGFAYSYKDIAIEESLNIVRLQP
ncbi:MAG: hypothetical protein E6X17_09870 [Sporomusaceae bacterium]|nr:hypothetical protein [Sporomusaceae bacterium]